MPVLVYVWKNFRGLAAAYHPGHASLMLTPVDRDTSAPLRDIYASWWPGEATKKQLKGLREPIKNSFSSISPQANRTFYQDAFREMSETTRARLQNGEFVPRPQQQRMVVPGAQGSALLGIPPREVWVQNPDITILLPGKDEPVNTSNGATIPGVGLNVKRMVWFWTLFASAPNARYKMASDNSNCSAVVLNVLEAGGIHLFTGKRCSRPIGMTPRHLVDYVEEVAETINRINSTLSELSVQGHSVSEEPLEAFNVALQNRSRASIRRVNRYMNSRGKSLMKEFDLPRVFERSQLTQADLPNDIWSLEEWKSASYVKIGRRKEQVKAIDKLIEDYHQLKEIDYRRPRALLRKVSILLQILSQTHDHMRTKHRSDRHDAVFELAKQAHTVYSILRLYEDDARQKIASEPDVLTDPDLPDLPMNESRSSCHDPAGGTMGQSVKPTATTPSITTETEAVLAVVQPALQAQTIQEQYSHYQGADVPHELSEETKVVHNGGALIAETHPTRRPNLSSYGQRAYMLEHHPDLLDDLDAYSGLGWDLS